MNPYRASSPPPAPPATPRPNLWRRLLCWRGRHAFDHGVAEIHHVVYRCMWCPAVDHSPIYYRVKYVPSPEHLAELLKCTPIWHRRDATRRAANEERLVAELALPEDPR